MILPLFIYLALLFILGWTAVNLILKQAAIEEHIGLSFLLGSGIHSIIYFIVLRLSFRVFNSLLILIIETVFLLVINLSVRHKTRHVRLLENQKHKNLKIFLLLGASLVLLYIFIQCVYWPVYEPDTVYLYDFRAQRLLVGDVTTFFKGTDFYRNGIYPPFTSLMHFFIRQVGSFNPKIIYPLILSALYLTIVGYVKRKTKSSFKGLLTGVLIISTPSILWNSTMAESNIVYAAYLSLGSLYLLDSQKNDYFHKGEIVIGCLLLGISALVRSEPFWIIAVGILFAKILLKKEFLINSIVGGFVYLMSRLWSTSLIKYHVNSGTISMQSIIYGNGVPHDLSYYLGMLRHFLIALYNSWGLIPFLFLLILSAVFIVYKELPSWINTGAIFLSLSILVGIIEFSRTYDGWLGLSDSVYRMATIAIPLFWVGIIRSRIWNWFKLYEK